MLDQYMRDITYLRISVTDHCNLRCIYCMPKEGVAPLCKKDLLTDEEILRLATLFAKLGIKKIRLTGGEPLLHPNLHELVAGLKKIKGIEKVVLTTNGLLLEKQLPLLIAAGLDGVNISLDAMEENTFRTMTRSNGHQVHGVLQAIEKALSYPKLQVKVNCVPTKENESQLLPMVEHLLKEHNISLRFIELMPIGEGKSHEGIPEHTLRHLLEQQYGPLLPMVNKEGSGNCRLYAIPYFKGRVGFISAMSHQFCQSCNRVRLTTDGFLKTCLQYNHGIALKPLLAQSDQLITHAICQAIGEKPQCHQFHTKEQSPQWETRWMSNIGG